MPLLAASEKGTGQAESPFEREAEMWLGKSKESKKNFLERNTSEGDSPVFEDSMMELKKSRASWIGGLNTAGLTANPKYNQSPIAQ
ncbi:MAG: hypothetical protein A2596_04035 [Candidatus Levybacteria bacterium RIFOXYD1_FULL_40_21]|nr:MAG: hypothetical protein A2423_03340 [Candidatus Levybacteria bacterium RIFOXYC1_FULL_40_10]OGH54453.1 MAG: hypothetical protein A2596_04035 [Candidatus Levybacteria bacterium RIFOXYD1_FULL_40_21]OGH69897.1 MAG: hypothetical protein A2396_04230 [Candidatus Levybacteria bacterium RIFOXYB1_FULL_40_17]